MGNGVPTTGARDVFAIGVTLYELVCIFDYAQATGTMPPICQGSAQLPKFPPEGTFLTPALFRWLQSLTRSEARQRPTAAQALAQLKALKQPRQTQFTKSHLSAQQNSENLVNVPHSRPAIDIPI